MLRQAVERAAQIANLSGAVVQASERPEHFGDGEVVFQVGIVLVRVVRDRGQEFVDLAPASRPDQWAYQHDVASALGWSSPALSGIVPPPIQSVFDELAARLNELSGAFAPEQLDTTLANIRAAAARRRSDL